MTAQDVIFCTRTCVIKRQMPLSDRYTLSLTLGGIQLPVSEYCTDIKQHFEDFNISGCFLDSQGVQQYVMQ